MNRVFLFTGVILAITIMGTISMVLNVDATPIKESFNDILDGKNNADTFSDDFMINFISKETSHSAKILDFEGYATNAAIDEKTNTIYVTDVFSAKLYIIDGNTDEVLESIDLTLTPFGVGVNPETQMIYIAGEFSGNLLVLNATTKQVEVDIPLIDPYDIAVNPTNNMIYVTSDNSNLVYVIDGTTHKVVTSWDVMNPCGIAVNTNTGIVYVTSESENLVQVFDGNTNEIITIIDVEDSPRGVAVSPHTNMIYVTNQETNTISVIDGSNNKLVKSVPVGEVPRRVAINSASNIVYVTNQESSDISIIDGFTNQVIETIPVSEPFEIAVNSVTNKVYSMYYGAKLSIITPQESQLLDSPLKQFSEGIDPTQVLCKEGFELVFKSTNFQPACVKPSSVEKLIQRGWAN